MLCVGLPGLTEWIVIFAISALLFGVPLWLLFRFMRQRRRSAQKRGFDVVPKYRD